MATTNYGLPTFNGAEADKPIQFESTITQGFQKIDEVMKNNADAAAPVADLANAVNQLNDRIPTNFNVIPIITSDSGLTIEHPAIEGSPIQHSWFNGLELHLYIRGQLNTDLASGTVIASVNAEDELFKYVPSGIVFLLGSTHLKTQQSTDETHTAYNWGYTQSTPTKVNFVSGTALRKNYYQGVYIDAIIGATFSNATKNTILPPPSMKDVENMDLSGA